MIYDNSSGILVDITFLNYMTMVIKHQYLTVMNVLKDDMQVYPLEDYINAPLIINNLAAYL